MSPSPEVSIAPLTPEVSTPAFTMPEQKVAAPQAVAGADFLSNQMKIGTNPESAMKGFLSFQPDQKSPRIPFDESRNRAISDSIENWEQTHPQNRFDTTQTRADWAKAHPTEPFNLQKAWNESRRSALKASFAQNKDLLGKPATTEPSPIQSDSPKPKAEIEQKLKGYLPDKRSQPLQESDKTKKQFGFEIYQSNITAENWQKRMVENSHQLETVRSLFDTLQYQQERSSSKETMEKLIITILIELTRMLMELTIDQTPSHQSEKTNIPAQQAESAPLNQPAPSPEKNNTTKPKTEVPAPKGLIEDMSSKELMTKSHATPLPTELLIGAFIKVSQEKGTNLKNIAAPLESVLTAKK